MKTIRWNNDGDMLCLRGNRMAVVDVQLVFTLGKSLALKQTSFTEAQVFAAIESLRPGLEFPDSRFTDFKKAGSAGLIADNACAAHMVMGQLSSENFDLITLADHMASLSINGKVSSDKSERDGLDGPVSAMVWMANRLNRLGIELEAGQFVTTSVSRKPTPVSHGDTVRADMGKHGSVTVILN